MRKMQGERTPVKVIRTNGNATLVEYLDEGVLTRRTLPTEKVVDGMVADQVLRAGVPYGFPWEEIPLNFDMQKFANELHQIGLWTAEDVVKSPQKVWSALRAALADNLATVLETARHEQKGVRHAK